MFAVLVGFGILTMALFPLALPGLLLVVAPLLLVVAIGALLALPLVLPLWLVRSVVRSRSRSARSATANSLALGSDGVAT
jgi:hypothetical protein